ncbi:unnamed protein product [Protopolystoma xenopodis]|uniref:Uncharacterized protein n=1 Tax=Protopolystoma xenopodis TaxID=117903 RepID=A0A448X6Q9_9PLAT|nr:unnamed protein product [Protopolystoma xenopodis]
MDRSKPQDSTDVFGKAKDDIETIDQNEDLVLLNPKPYHVFEQEPVTDMDEIFNIGGGDRYFNDSNPRNPQSLVTDYSASLAPQDKLQAIHRPVELFFVADSPYSVHACLLELQALRGCEEQRCYEGEVAVPWYVRISSVGSESILSSLDSPSLEILKIGFRKYP